MKKIDEIDFSALYRHHFKELGRPISRPEQWDARAEKITSDWQPNDYVYALLEGMQLQNKETVLDVGAGAGDITLAVAMRSEEHTSELQSRGHLVCRLLLEKENRCNI